MIDPLRNKPAPYRRDAINTTMRFHEILNESSPHEERMPPIRPPTDDVHEVMDASFYYGRNVGPKMVPIDSLSGGVSSDPREKMRVQKLKQEIMSKDGYISRLIVDTEGNVIEGQHRLEALRELGFKNVPVYVIQDLSIGIDTDAVIQAMRQAQPMHMDQCVQVLRNLLNTIADENGSVEIAKNDYEAPGFQSAWDAACDAITKSKLSESYQEGPDDAFVDGGNEYRINDIFKATEKALVFDVPISKLKWQMEKENDEDRINSADCSVPILVWKKGNRLICVDGMHRLQKAVRFGLKTLPAKYVLDTIMKKARISESSDGKITLRDIYDNSELYDRSEAIGQLVDNYGDGLLSERFTVREMMPADAIKLKSFGGTSIRSAFRKAASKEQKEIVQNKKTQFDPSRIIVLSRNRVVDGHHHLIAAIQLNRPVKYIDLEEEPLNELARPKTRVQADEILRNAGYSRLGNGAFGAVYRKPGKPYVLKVFAATDKPYLAFVDLAKKHQDNPHFPKFFGKVVNVTPNVSAIRMEPLTPFKYDCRPIRAYLNWRDHPKLGPDSIITMQLGDAEELFEAQPGLKEACDLVIDNLFTRYRADIKQDNFMVRGKTIVFIDPVSHIPYIGAIEELPHVEPPEPEPKFDSSDDELMRQLFGP